MVPNNLIYQSLYKFPEEGDVVTTALVPTETFPENDLRKLLSTNKYLALPIEL